MVCELQLLAAVATCNKLNIALDKMNKKSKLKLMCLVLWIQQRLDWFCMDWVGV